MTRSGFRFCIFALPVTLFFLSAAAATSASETTPLRVSGYYKNLFVSSRTISTDKELFADTNRLRLQLDAAPAGPFSARVIYDQEILLNDYQYSPDFDLVREKNAKKRVIFDNYKRLVDSRPVYWLHNLYRAHIKYATDNLHVIAGKQAIDWSRTRLYHPFDVFNAISPLDIERDEKTGVDAVNTELFFPNSTSLGLLYLPYDYCEKAGLGLRLATKVGDYDIQVIGANYRKETSIGAGFDGYIGESGFRGELLATRPENDKDYLRGAIELDHTFTPELYGIVEYFYNGGSAREPERFFASYEYSRRAFSIREHIIAAGLEYEISGVMKTAHYLFYDFQGKGVFYNPELRYNIRENIDLVFGCQLFWGQETSEYGKYENTYYAQAKCYF